MKRYIALAPLALPIGWTMEAVGLVMQNLGEMTW
jgi:hypothetical protein